MANYDAAQFVGHGTSEVDGSYDPGATSNGKQEHIIAEQITDKAVALCKAKGLNIHRDEQNYKDNDLAGNTYRYKYAQSIHLNAGKGRRAEIYTPCKDAWLDAEFYMLAELEKIGLVNGGVRSRDYDSEQTFMRTNGVALPYRDYYGEISRAYAQGISLDIIEVGFIDSSDLVIIENNIDKIATIIANGMLMICGKELYSLNNSNNDQNESEVYCMKYAVCYCNPVDERFAKTLRDHLGANAQAMDATIPMTWSNVASDGVIAVGGDAPSGSIGFSSTYTTHRINASNRYETAQLVLDICSGKRNLEDFRVK